MSELEELWRHKSDDQVVEAFTSLDKYSADGQRVIRGEFLRRGLIESSKKPLTLVEVEHIARLHRRFAALVGAQWMSIIPMTLLPRSVLGPVLALCAIVFLVAVVSVPMTGYMLLKRLEVDSPGRTALLMYMPLFSLLTLLGMRTFNQQWSKKYGVGVGILGPTKDALRRLAEAEAEHFRA